MGSAEVSDLCRRLRSLMAEAALLPWRVDADVPEDVVVEAGDGWVANVDGGGHVTRYADGPGSCNDARSCANALFIAEACSALPELLRIVEELALPRMRRDEANAALSDAAWASVASPEDGDVYGPHRSREPRRHAPSLRGRGTRTR